LSGTVSAATASLIAAIVGGAGAAASIGTSIYEGDKSSDAQSAATTAEQQALTKQQQAQANQANLSKQEAVLGAQGQEQQQTGGSLTDSGTASLTDLLAGYPGYQGGGSGTSAGTGSGTGGVSGGATPTPSTGGAGGTGAPDINAILAALRSGGSGSGGGTGSPGLNLSGGNWQSQATQPQSWQELANPPLG
jgi:hypothetical protein